ncbi:MAG: gluconolactonase [Alteromonadaceae bacterium]|nr:gluconolactonase [Alteromonadaceae bacterium]MBH85449.1 gluconolactonase [Alteromonadaceae bacterium]|tara:strand:- start:26144 stop:27052 length:909 start_codon:yes stop_codon:yes gene_type:complete
MTDSPELLADGGTFFEGPRWHDGRWWVSDFYRQAVYTLSPAGGELEKVLDVPSQPSGLGWMPDGSLLVVSMRDHQVLRRWPDGKLTTHADISRYATGHANDMVVAADGSAWVGNFGFDLMGGEEMRPAALVHLDPEGNVSLAAEDLAFPNGMVILPDARTLVVGETFGNRMTAFTIAENGELTERRDWAAFGDKPEPGPRAELLKQLAVGPDGCCLDRDGQIWIADAFNQRCIRVAEGGGITAEIKAPAGLGVFACMLGGPDGHTLLMCCAPDSSATRRMRAREASLWTVRVASPAAVHVAE